MMQFKIPYCVCLKSIKHDANKNTRTYLKFKFKNVIFGRKLFVVMLNPSNSFIKNSNTKNYNYKNKYIDKTCYNVINKLNEFNLTKLIFKYKIITIINLFSNYATNPEHLNTIYKFIPGKSVKPHNTQYMKNINEIKSFNYKGHVVFAWGKGNGIPRGSLNQAINEMKSIFYNNKKFHYNCGLKKYDGGLYPRHGLRW